MRARAVARAHHGRAERHPHRRARPRPRAPRRRRRDREARARVGKPRARFPAANASRGATVVVDARVARGVVRRIRRVLPDVLARGRAKPTPATNETRRRRHRVNEWRLDVPSVILPATTRLDRRFAQIFARHRSDDVSRVTTAPSIVPRVRSRRVRREWIHRRARGGLSRETYARDVRVALAGRDGTKLARTRDTVVTKRSLPSSALPVLVANDARTMREMCARAACG